MRYASGRDYQTIVGQSTEVTQVLVDVNVIIYKLIVAKTPTNSYDEAVDKTWYQPGVLCAALIDREQTNPFQEMNIADFKQKSKFSFLRNMLWQKQIYPEAGDIIQYDAHYYEIHNTNEIQMWAGQEEYNHAIVCETHLTRKQNLQLDPPTL